jgi:3-oxoacyl-[acyl-carrier protein] reductase
MEFAGKVALVTGSAQGIGKAAAEAFAREGAAVILNDINEERLNEAARGIREAGGSCAAIQASTSVYSEVESMFDRVRDEFGRLDALVNNAGITRDALLHKMTEEQWRQVIEVNLTGVFFCLQAGARIMRDAGHGSIINISSDSRFGNAGQANYSASRAGVVCGDDGRNVID